MADGGVLCLNAGSASLKFALFPAAAAAEPGAPALPAALLRGEIDAPGGVPVLRFARAGQPRQTVTPEAVRGDIGAEVAWLVDWLSGWMAREGLGAPARVAHRIVHGGRRYTQATRITPAVLDDLRALTDLAPLHQGPGLDGVRSAQAALPGAVQVACFDTAFHAGHTDAERRYAIPREWHDQGFQRYGFHGLSYDAINRQLPALLGERARSAVVVAHLGSGASLCGLRDGASVTTTMGFTALDGLMMATRCGALDPGLVLHWTQQPGMDAARLTELLYTRSGLLGVSGLSADPRDLYASADPRAREALELFIASVVRQTGAVAAALGGLDALVFTGGIGTHQAPIRAAVVGRLGWLGLALDAAANERHAVDIGAPGSRVALLCLPTDEEAVMALQAAGC
ncbi:MAG: acetate kinase [Rubrivivax sp. SCN 70-15]|nr:MAG: acetate kinase [Rubrivivax sp. SCN 70-15]